MQTLVDLARKRTSQEIRMVRDVFMGAFAVNFGVRVWIYSQDGSTQVGDIIGMDNYPILELLLIFGRGGAAHFVGLSTPVSGQVYQPMRCRDGFYVGYVRCNGDVRRVNDQGQYPWGRDDQHLAAFAKVHQLRQAKPANCCTFNHVAVLLLECGLVHPMDFLRGYSLHRAQGIQV